MPQEPSPPAGVPEALLSAWFTGPKAENGAWFNSWLQRIADDYCAWRRNYFPEDAAVLDSELRRRNEPFVDAFEDRLGELLARLKGDVPFYSPRYAAHMLAEQTLPAIAGYFAAMLYNPNNVTAESAPVTVRLELEAGMLLCRMIGYEGDAWAHLCSGGTSANIEALWAARTVKYLPFVVRDMRKAAGLPERRARDAELLGTAPAAALEEFVALWRDIRTGPDADARAARAQEAFNASAYNVAERGVASVCAELRSSPALVVPESHHYCFEKALDVLGIGRQGLVTVGVDADFRMRPQALQRALDDVERRGGHVLAVVAVIGSTEEGSVDPLDKIVALREARERVGKASFWIHADGAYGGYLRTVTLPRRAGLGEPVASVKVAGVARDVRLTLPEKDECDALEALGRADSVTIDPHKLGYIPYPAGAICFRSSAIKPLLRQAAPYLADAPMDIDAERASDAIGLYVLEGSKPGAQAAAVWLSHTLIPLDASGHGMLIKEDIRNACELHALLEGYGGMAGDPGAGGVGGVRAVTLCTPGSNIVCYAFRPAMGPATLGEINALNRALYERFSLHAGRRVYEQEFFVSRTSLSSKQYSPETVGPFLERLGVSVEEYAREGVFLLRSVLMNPWYSYAKRRGRYYLSELVEALHAAGEEIVDAG